MSRAGVDVQRLCSSVSCDGLHTWFYSVSKNDKLVYSVAHAETWNLLTCRHFSWHICMVYIEAWLTIERMTGDMLKLSWVSWIRSTATTDSLCVSETRRDKHTKFDLLFIITPITCHQTTENNIISAKVCKLRVDNRVAYSNERSARHNNVMRVYSLRCIKSTWR